MALLSSSEVHALATIFARQDEEKKLQELRPVDFCLRTQVLKPMLKREHRILVNDLD
jgi:hypothetical protein